MTSRPGDVRDLHADERAHFMSTMEFEHRVEGGEATGRVTVDDYMRTGPDWPSTAALLTFADVLIGLLASHQTAPRISITSDLSVHVAGPLTHGGELELTGRLTKVGRSMTVGQTTMRAAGSGDLVAVGVGSFVASPRPQDVADSFAATRPAIPPKRHGSTLAEHVGVRVLEPGVAEIGLRSDLTNATASLQGGLVALLGEIAAQGAVRDALGSPAVVESLEVRYLAAARVGPFRTRTAVLAPHLVEVEVTDSGREGRTVALAMARTRPAPVAPGAT